MLGGRQLQVILPMLTILTGSLLALPCEWKSGNGKLKPNSPRAQILDQGRNIAICRTACYQTTARICVAVNYKDTQCHLLIENPETMEIESEPGWQYSIRPICEGMWLPWTTVRGRSIEEPRAISTVFYDSSLDNCLLGCLSDPSCYATNYATGLQAPYCTHLTGNFYDDVNTVPDANWQYFIKPRWYLDSPKTASAAEVYDKGTIESYLHIFTEERIPVSGYLVGWQYYHKNNRQCQTFLSVWRKVGESSYSHISKTQIYPDQKPGSNHNNLQFLSNQLVRVEKGDLLGVHAVSHYERCQFINLAVNASEGQLTISSSTPVSIDATSRTFEQSNNPTRFVDGENGVVYRNASPALKAYVSGYLSLESAPTPHNNHSLAAGQKWLILPPPLTTEESTVIIGYRVKCSKDANMTILVNCFDHLVPVTSEIVLLTLVDATRAYYAAIQIARNFKGREELERTLSPSAVVCMTRNKTERVSIEEELTDDEYQSWRVTITLHHIFQENDTCASGIEFVINGYFGEQMPINASLETSFSSTKDERNEFSINLILADNTTMQFWNATYTTGITATTTTPTTTTTSTTTTTTTTSATIPTTVITTTTPTTTTAATTTATSTATSTTTSTTDTTTLSAGGNTSTVSSLTGDLLTIGNREGSTASSASMVHATLNFLLIMLAAGIGARQKAFP